MALTDIQKDRYSRQILLDEVKEEGQQRLLAGSVVIIGCGGLGTVSAENIARAGVGRVTIVDRDVIELNNLQRQMLFTEADVDRPKAVVAARKLGEINSGITVEPLVEDVNPKNVLDIVRGHGVVVDATDNMETRFLMNDACVSLGIPWVYGGAVGTLGMTMTIVPGVSPCFRCLAPKLPPRGQMATCDTDGVLNAITGVIGSVQAVEALRLLMGREPSQELWVYDAWSRKTQSVRVPRDGGCACCVGRDFGYLTAPPSDMVTTLCGTGAVQITPVSSPGFSFWDLEAKLKKVGQVKTNEYLMRFHTGEYDLTIFRNGRTIVHGTDDGKVARSVYARYVGV